MDTETLLPSDQATNVDQLSTRRRETVYTNSRSAHGISLICNMVAFGTTLNILLIHTGAITNGQSYFAWSHVLLGVSLLVYYIEAFCCSHTLQYLRNVKTSERTVEFMRKLQCGRPEIMMFAESYHYETRHHTRTKTNAEGQTITEHYTTSEKVVTHRVCLSSLFFFFLFFSFSSFFIIHFLSCLLMILSHVIG